MLSGAWSRASGFPVFTMDSAKCPERERLREVHRRAIDEWLAESQLDRYDDAPRTEKLKRAIGATMEDLLEHRKRHGC